MQIGISTSCFFGQYFVEDCVDEIGKMGVPNIEIFLNTTSEYDDSFIDILIERTKRYGLNVCSLHPFGIQYEPHLSSRYSRCREDAEAIYVKVLKAASRIGAKNIIFHGGLSFKSNLAKPNLDNLAATMDRLVSMANDYNLSLCYENVHWCWFKYPSFADELLSRMQEKNLFFNFDAKQAVQSGYDPVEYITHMGSRIANVHICDCITEDASIRTALPFQGTIDFYAIRDALKNISYNGPLMLEIYNKDFTKKEELLSCYQKVSQFFG